MDYWKSKVVPKFKKIFEKNGAKKAAAAQLCKTFDDSKEECGKDFEDKKTELQPKVVEIYEACSSQIKALVKDPKDTALKKNSADVQKFLDELVKIDFPGSKAVSEACSKVGPAYLSGPVSFVFEKVSSLLPEEKKEEAAPPPPAAAAEAKEAEVSEKEAVAEEPKSEAPPSSSAPEAAAPVTEPPAAVEPPKPEEKPAEAPKA